jgi:hypothetical protein
MKPLEVMMKRILTLSNLRLALEAILVLAVLAAVVLHFAPTRAAAPDPAAPAALYWYQCNTPASDHVAVFTDRVHIWCPSTTPVAGAPALTGIYWFAFPTSPDSAAASRFMSLMQTATIAGRNVWVEVNPTDTSGGTFGCGTDNCRRIYGLELR